MLFAPALYALILSIVHKGQLIANDFSLWGNPLFPAIDTIRSTGHQPTVVFHELFGFLQSIEARPNCIPRRCGSLLRKLTKRNASANRLLTPPQNLLNLLPVYDHRRRPQPIRPE